MLDTTRCEDFGEQAPLLLGGGLSSREADRLSRHAEACPACARVLRRQVRLEAWLDGLPAAPSARLARPALPAGPVPSLRSARPRRRLAAGAAGLAAAALVVLATLLEGDVDRSFEPVRVLHVEDVAEHAPLPDDDLLALTAGLETVALRRPTGWAADAR